MSLKSKGCSEFFILCQKAGTRERMNELFNLLFSLEENLAWKKKSNWQCSWN